MKQRRRPQEDRRRPLIEPNLTGETKSTGVSSKGIFAWLRKLLVRTRRPGD